MLLPSALLVLTSALGPCVPAAPPSVLSLDDDLRQAYESGQAFGDFLQDADARKELWDRNYGSADVPNEVLERAQALGGTWYILAIAVAGCSDSVNTIPYVARLTELAPNLHMRIIPSSAGRQYMEDRPTPDGRAATPTLILLDANFDEVGCWIERPSPLQEWALGEGSEMSRRAFMEEKMSWYREDAGRHTVDEVVAILEGAADGQRICGT